MLSCAEALDDSHLLKERYTFAHVFPGHTGDLRKLGQSKSFDCGYVFSVRIFIKFFKNAEEPLTIFKIS